jgi:trehalose 2-sulfotransferase
MSATTTDEPMTGKNDRAARVYDLALAAADYPAWNGPPRRTLIICTQQRCGSTLLGEAIYFAGGLGCPLEYFHAGFRSQLARRWNAAGLHNYAAAAHRFRTDGTGVFGVKLFWWDVADLVQELAPSESFAFPSLGAARSGDDTYRRVLQTIAGLFPHPTFVFLWREDKTRQAISLSIAGEMKEWRQFSGNGPAQPRAPSYDFDRIVQYLAVTQNDDAHWKNFFRVNGLQPYIIRYEDLEANYHATVKALFAAIGCPNAEITAPRLKKQADSTSEIFRQRFLTEFHRRARG